MTGNTLSKPLILFPFTTSVILCCPLCCRSLPIQEILLTNHTLQQLVQVIGILLGVDGSVIHTL